VTFLGRLTRVAAVCGFTAVTLVPAAAWAQPPNLGSGESFAVLAGSTVANTGATTVTGDVGVGPGGSIAGDPITITGGSIHEGDAVAVQAQSDALEAYDVLVAMTCGTDLTGQNLGGQSLPPGVYCFDADAQLTGAALTLTGAGPWIFQIVGALSTDASVLVPDSTQNCNGSSVFWQVGGTATVGAGTTFVGNLLAQTSVDLGAGTIVDGRAVALDPASTVTLDANEVNACSFGNLVPVHAPIKVTGGGQINVPEPDSDGFANYGFNAKPEAAGGATGHLNYRNHVTGLHVNGTVTDVDVVTINPDGSPMMVRFSGTCTSSPTCTFSVVVEDNGEPADDDRFGITVVASDADETTADRVVKNGNIQFHLALTTSLTAHSFRAGEVMAVGVSVIPGAAPPKVDAYLVLRLPSGQLLSWTSKGFVPGIVPMVRNITPFNIRAAVARLVIPSNAPAGTYTWLSAFASPGTLNLVSDISERRFTITR
jgi:hypothetical protein